MRECTRGGGEFLDRVTLNKYATLNHENKYYISWWALHRKADWAGWR